MAARSGNKPPWVRKELMHEFLKTREIPSEETIKFLEAKYLGVPGCKNLRFHFILLRRYFHGTQWEFAEMSGMKAKKPKGQYLHISKLDMKLINEYCTNLNIDRKYGKNI